jgi:antitoxin HigA-1
MFHSDGSSTFPMERETRERQNGVGLESHTVGRASLRADLPDEQERQDWLPFPRRGTFGIPPRFAGRRLAETLALPLRGEYNMTMKNPPHPGRTIREDCLDPLELTVTEAAKVLKITRAHLSKLVNCHAGISPEMAVRLEKAGWSTAETWLKMQMANDLAEASKTASQIKVKHYTPEMVL